MIGVLLDTLGVNGVGHPLLTFAAILGALASAATGASPEHAATLQRWLADASGHWGLDVVAADVQRMRAHEASRCHGKQEIVLVLALEPTEKDRYRVHPYRSTTVRHGVAPDTSRLDLAEDREYRFDELGAVVQELLAKLPQGDPVVEVVAGLDLLARCAADQWPARNAFGEGHAPLGASYRVVLRSWDRCYMTEDAPHFALIRDRWQTQWRSFFDGTGLTDSSANNVALLWLDADHSRTKLRAPIGEEDLADLLQDGVAVAIWPRHPGAEDLDACFACLQPGTTQPDWREVVRRHRKRHRKQPEETHSGRCLVLLWDDFDRRPPDPAERVPELERRDRGT